ncbi:DNA polymerase III catalytic subunit, PolC type [Fructobacillus fructosus]|uniref:PolC-type DNA polymerase III n=1 Tax=Fructobacillus fructosus TaxID=1631 RepID=UPI000219602F|nr:PolC-type DNA polymerase III [Fructobacillus fructosus]KRN53262.1 DNA polymerase III catalytic subunit, PolC type [Fructobacillus fructosus KCTC 3544]GAP00761.1 DNA polymerase III catalytic subunit, PolC type [Fructobacillus fructosus]
MALSQREQLEKLMEQAQLPDNLKAVLNDASLSSVVVDPVAKTWRFILETDRVLTFAAYLAFYQGLAANFKQVKAVYLNVEPREAGSTEEEVQAYFHFALTQGSLSYALVQQLASASRIELKDQQHVVIATAAPTLAGALTEQTLADLSKSYADFGMSGLQFSVVVDEDQQQKLQEHFDSHQQQVRQNINQAIERAEKATPKKTADGVPLRLGRAINPDAEVTRLAEIDGEEANVLIEGYVFADEVRVLRSKRQLLNLKITDYSSSISAKKFSNNEQDEAVFEQIKAGCWVKVRGKVQEDTYARELVLNIYDLQVVDHQDRQDSYQGDEKRIELHTHTNMTGMDAVTDFGQVAKLARSWGQESLAVMDNGNVQGYPQAIAAGKKNDLKIIYGMEANVVEDGDPIAYNTNDQVLEDSSLTYVAFDLETTGLSAVSDRIIELSAVKMQMGNVIDKFSEYINPGFPLSEFTTNLTSITDAMVANAKPEQTVIDRFREWIQGSVLIGHNVTFDVDFMNATYARYQEGPIKEPVIDTLPFTRWLYPDYKSYRLGTLAKKFGIELEQAHRAIYDAETTGHLGWKLIKEAKKTHDVTNLNELNDHMLDGGAWRHGRPFHASLLVQNQVGLKNLYRLVSESNVSYFNKVPRIPRSVLEKFREGLIVGSGDTAGDLIVTLIEKGYEPAKKKAAFYDYLEIQPLPNYQPMLDSGLIAGPNKLKKILADMVKIGDELGKPVVVTGDVKYTNPEDHIYRDILIGSQPGNPLNRQKLPEVHFRTTADLLEEFDFLGEEKAKAVVIDNTHVVADELDDIQPLKEGSYPPQIPEAGDELREKTLAAAKEMYGNPIPEPIQERIDKELKAIIGHGFAPHYMISQRLVAKSNKDGYLVGSRGSVGSSFVATMSGITEVNPLPPHYRSAHGDYFELADPKKYGSGYDLPDKEDPNHPGELLIGDGHNIPFETFMGFTGNKVPDIDLNFSGDYQPIAHDYMKVMFGVKKVFRAGTIATVAEKTAFGYVKAYERDHEKQYRNAEEERLAQGVTGVKRTTGQHPGGILIVPADYDIYDFTPVQYPADDQNALWQTTHMDYHSIHDNLLKMDILGHDDPTMVRTLKDLSGIDPTTIPANDPGVLALFTSTEPLGVTPDQIYSNTGTLGLPEFGTGFVRNMLEDTQPHTYSELLQISGLSHGTDVWLGNAHDLVENGTATIATVIGTRDKIMTDLINWGLPADAAFNIMEKVRKGKGITDEYQKLMRDHQVPEWYIESCLKIKYMFPRAHAAAYVLMALRIAYFKVYFPAIYYATYFTVRANAFDVVAMARGKEAVKAAIAKIKDLGNEATKGDQDLQTVLEMANEALERGISFKMVDLNRSEATEWVIDGNELIPPFSVIPGLGDNVANQIVASRAEKPFISKEDLKKRGKVSQTIIDFLTLHSVISDLPDENQLSLFDF